MEKENKISFAIRGAAFRIYNNLGPGLLESVYEKALYFELTQSGFDVRSQVGIPVEYGDFHFDQGFRLDLLVNNRVIIEIKSVDQLADVHKKQLLTYLKLTRLRLGILINFNTDNLKRSIIRIIN